MPAETWARLFRVTAVPPTNHPQRLLLAGLSGGSGKTIATLAVIRAQVRRGLRVKPFKKGPDYIDAAWLALAAGNPATNLDPFLLAEDRLKALFLEKSQGFDLAVIEGNRGLYDGKDVEGSCSSAALARQIQAPVVVIIDATKMTRTAAAVLHGLATFEPDTPLQGVILNRTAGERHRSILTRSIEHYTDLKVMGAFPKLESGLIPERHMGLVSDQEHGLDEDGPAVLDRLADLAEEWLDLDGLDQLARSAPLLAADPGVSLWPTPRQACADRPVTIGYVRDAALWFYYPENLEALERAGARLVRLSLLSDEPWPEIHGLYLGGGFPETHARQLSANTALRAHVAGLAERGLPIYAECGGFMFLCRSLEFQGGEYPMAGVLPLSTGFCPRPQGLGYTEARVVEENPFFEVGSLVRGHEFHYSRCLAPLGHVPSEGPRMALVMERGQGMLHGLDGVLQGNTFAAYNHIFALAEPGWALRFTAAAAAYRDGDPATTGPA